MQFRFPVENSLQLPLSNHSSSLGRKRDAGRFYLPSRTRCPPREEEIPSINHWRGSDGNFNPLAELTGQDTRVNRTCRRFSNPVGPGTGSALRIGHATRFVVGWNQSRLDRERNRCAMGYGIRSFHRGLSSLLSRYQAVRRNRCASDVLGVLRVAGGRLNPS
jgi:hypothetical protein